MHVMPISNTQCDFKGIDILYTDGPFAISTTVMPNTTVELNITVVLSTTVVVENRPAACSNRESAGAKAYALLSYYAPVRADAR